jgi:uncharacterized repeat protein (TIGR01451 family)
MISDGSARPGLRSGLPNLLESGGGNNGAAVISLGIGNPLPIITDAYTSIDGTTQTINVGDTNSGQVGTGASVGVNNTPINRVDRPEIMIDGRNLSNSTSGDQYAITLNADHSIVRGIGVYGTKGDYQTSQAGDSGAIRVGGAAGNNISTSGAALITNNLVGTLANGADPGSNDQNQRYGIACLAPCNIYQNYIAYNGYGTLLSSASANQSEIIGNEYQFNGPNLAPNTSGPGGYGSADGDSIAIWSTSNTKIQGNLIANTRGISSNTIDSGKGIEIVNTLSQNASNNLIENNTIDQSSTAGIGLYSGAVNNTIQLNIIRNTTPVSATPFAGPGILISATPPLPMAPLVMPEGNFISRNSIYNNKGLSIDLNPISGSIGEGVTGNDGNILGTVPNLGMDYPIFTKVDLYNDRLYLEGYVGKETTLGSGDSDFANATIEVFIAQDDGDNNGEVFAGDGQSQPHGEGQVYIATITADANGKFNTNIDVSGRGITNLTKITATATKNGSTSEFNANSVTTTAPKLYLIKRITRINNSTSHEGKDLTLFDDDLTSPRKDEDNHPHWPSNYIKGVIDGGTVKPQDEIEYTIYFLNVGQRDANRVRICDLITTGQTYVTDTYGSSSNDGGAVTSSGIELSISNNPSFFLTGATDSDRGEYFPPGTIVPNCKFNSGTGQIDPISPAENVYGVVVVNITKTSGVNTFPSIKRISPVQNPTDDSYGFFRFRTRVK